MVNMNEDPEFVKGQVIVVVAQRGFEVAKCSTEFQSVTRVGNSFVIEFAHQPWEMEERRRSPRLPVDWSATLWVPGIIGESEGMVSRFEDIGVGGGLLITDIAPPVGCLVQWKCSIGNDGISGLALVVRSDSATKELALEFVELYGNSKTILQSFTDKMAA